jgi:hypothetical protein
VRKRRSARALADVGAHRRDRDRFARARVADVEDVEAHLDRLAGAPVAQPKIARPVALAGQRRHDDLLDVGQILGQEVVEDARLARVLERAHLDQAPAGLSPITASASSPGREPVTSYQRRLT